MNKKVLFMAAICMSLWYAPRCNASDRVAVDIDKILEMVESSNSDVLSAKRGVNVSEEGIKVANAAKLPDVDLSLRFSYLGDITLTDRDFSNITRYPAPHYNNTLGITLYQPVYAGGAITAGVNLAKTQKQMSEVGHEQVRQAVSIQAIGCYLELLKARNLLSVYDENIRMTRKLLDDMRSRYDSGVALRNDITRYELRLSTLDYDRLTLVDRINVTTHDLCSFLNLPDGTEIEVNDDDILKDLPSLENKDSWQNKAMTNSNDMSMLNLESEMLKHKRSLLKAEQLPHVGLIAGDSFDGPITFEIPAINKNLNYWWVGVNISYSISSLFKTNKSLQKNSVETAQLMQRREGVSDKIDRTIDETFTMFRQSYDRLSTEEKNVELATENYRIVENRFNNQLALLSDMLDASTSKLDADVRLVNARINIVYYYYQLKYNSGTL
jgi:outer membrane protein TolC